LENLKPGHFRRISSVFQTTASLKPHLQHWHVHLSNW